jgi:ligand-binding sensor domain-containing protein
MEDSVVVPTRTGAIVLFVCAVFAASCSRNEADLMITQHLDSAYVVDIAPFGNDVYCATRGGLVRWDLDTEQFTVYTTADGMPSNICTSLLDGGDGLLWVGTLNGLVSFDGTIFTVYDTGDELPSNEIEDITLDNAGTLWVATAKGLSVRKDSRFASPGFAFDPGGPISIIMFDKADNLWVGTHGKGIYMAPPDDRAKIGRMPSLVGYDVEALGQSWDGKIWATTPMATCTFDGIVWLPNPLGKYIDTFRARDYKATGERLWLFTDKGVFTGRGNMYKGFDQKAGLISDDTTCGYVVSDSLVYVGTSDGMSVIRDGAITNYFVPNTSLGYDCLSLAADRDGRIWMGTLGTGVSLYDNGCWAGITAPDEKLLNTVRDITFGPKGEIVFSTTDGAVFNNGRDWTLFTRDNGMAADDIRCGTWDAKGCFWAATAAGISVYDGVRWRRWQQQDGLPSEDIRACGTDSTGTVWFGTAAGVISVADGAITDRTPEIGLDAPDVRAILTDGDRVLFGTEDGRLFAFVGGKWEKFGTGYTGVGNVGIHAIAMLPDGTLCLGTNGAGIVMIGDNGRRVVTVKDGLPSNDVRDLAVRDGALWAACFGGAAEIATAPTGR